MLRVGLTGGIACGKSTVARELRRLGVAVVDADQLARRVVEPGRPALEEIAGRFGSGVLDEQGRLDRAALGRIVFDDPRAKSDLEAITHPRIAEEAARELASLEAAGEPLAVYEASLIIEAGLQGRFDILVVVVARRETQIARLRRRDGLGEPAAEARLAAQMPAEDKARHGDYVISTEGSLRELRDKVAELHQELRRLAGEEGADGQQGGG